MNNGQHASMGRKGGIKPGNSAEAYRDNLEGAINLLTHYSRSRCRARRT
ncbi:MAG: hypothetical protein ACI9QL_001592 [Candidatus Omnitrophota bacterium]|jgi:hypothetical protein